MYDPTIGRWLSADPIGFEAGDVNLYRYCSNGVLSLVDPDGLAEQTWMPTVTIHSAKGYTEKTPDAFQHAVWKDFDLLVPDPNDPDKRKDRQDSDPKKKMYGWTFAIYTDTPATRRDNSKPGGTSDFLIKWVVDATLDKEGCCNWSLSNLDFFPVYNVYSEFEAKGVIPHIEIPIPNGTTVAVLPGPTVKDHELWHLKGETIRFQAGDKIYVTKVGGVIPYAQKQADDLLKVFANGGRIPSGATKEEKLAHCRTHAKSLFDKYFLGVRETILNAGAWHSGDTIVEGNDWTWTWSKKVEAE